MDRGLNASSLAKRFLVLAAFILAVCKTKYVHSSAQKIWFLTFQDTHKPHHVQHSELLAKEAKAVAKFDEAIIYTRDQLPKWWWEVNTELHAEPHTLYLGAWKPYIILDTLMKMPEGDILWYMDAMYSIAKPLDTLMANLTDGMRGFCNKPNERSERVRSQAPKEVLQFFLMEKSDVLDKEAFYPGALVVQKSLRTLTFVSTWAAFAGQWTLVRPRLRATAWLQDPSFKWAPGEQTVMSVLAYKYGYKCDHFPPGLVHHRVINQTA